MYKALARGLSFKLTMGNILTLTPPLTLTKDEMGQARLRQYLRKYGGPDPTKSRP